MIGAVPAVSADERKATLTFTQDSWEHVHRTLEQEYAAGDQIVGWYHSHPGFGVFLSGHDLFIQRNFFSGPSQIAVVVDPIGQREGSFVWDGGEVVCLYERPTQGTWVADSDLVQANEGVVQPVNPSGGKYPLVGIAVAVVLGLLFGFGLSGIAGQDASQVRSKRSSVPTGGQNDN